MAHPSTRTNNNNLNGNETNIGESIIIPKDISIDAITISITRNGKNNKNPIWKAVLSSEVIKAGSITEKEHHQVLHMTQYLTCQKTLKGHFFVYF